MHLERNGLAFCNFLAQEYFERLLYCFLNGGTKGGAKTEYKAGKQQAKEDVLKYYKNKLSLFLQANIPAEHNLEQFKSSVLVQHRTNERSEEQADSGPGRMGDKECQKCKCGAWY